MEVQRVIEVEASVVCLAYNRLLKEVYGAYDADARIQVARA